MGSTDNRANQNCSLRQSMSNQVTTRTVPILQVPDIKTSNYPSDGNKDAALPISAASMAPPTRMSPDNDTNDTHDQIGLGDQAQTCNLTGPNAAAAVGQQPKVVQTAFIHKLYNMLEDQNIQHLISWSNSAESFVMSPSTDFAKVLSQYFKHTNISSFVRQLNMYGFHKVSDVFHTGSPDSPLWEFKHGNGSFRRGDLVGLRDIKRRASRHALVHRDAYSGPKPPLPQPGAPAETLYPPQLSVHEPSESRLSNLEHSSCEIHALLHRIEENSHVLRFKNQVIMDALSQSLQMNQEMSKILLSMIPSSDIHIHREVTNMEVEIQRQIEHIRSFDEHSEIRPYISTMIPENGPVSPRQVPQDDTRRIQTGGPQSWRHSNRPPIHADFSTNSRRFGTFGASHTHTSPTNPRVQAPTNPPSSHTTHALVDPVPNPSSPANIARRHTSADIRNVQRWNTNQLPNCHNQNLPPWQTSPKRGLASMNEEQRIHASFSSYSIANATSHYFPVNSRPTTPPPSSNGSTADHIDGWSWASGRDKSGISSHLTRRGSMAHILNPADTAERLEEHEEDFREEDRKRKRVSFGN